MYRLAFLSVHGCPVARLGEKDTGGMNVYVLQVARELGRRGNKVDVYTRYHYPNDPQVIDLGDNVRVIHLKAGPYDRSKGGLHQHVPEFLVNLRRFQQSEDVYYDLVHSHYWLSGCAGAKLSKEWNIPHVTTFHTLARKKMQARVGEMESQLRIGAESRVIRGADAIVVSTNHEREDLSRLYQTDPRKVWVVPAGVDLELFRPADKTLARQKLGLTEKKIVLSVGRIEPLKGLDILIGAMAGLADTTDTRLLIVGGQFGRDRELGRLKSLVANMGIQDSVTFAGVVNQAELPTFYSAADVFVMPSYYESFGLAALEAMACGAPVIVSSAGGPNTFVTNGESGYLIPWHCPEPYVQRLDMLLTNPGLQEKMSRAAITKARTMGWNTTASRTLDVYIAQMEAARTSVVGA